MTLTEEHLVLLRQLVDLPPGKLLRHGSVPAVVKELEDAGYATITAIGISDLLSEITDAGRRAIAEADSRLDAAPEDNETPPDSEGTSSMAHDGAPAYCDRRIDRTASHGVDAAVDLRIPQSTID